jgi:hypothetical protein
MKVNFKKVVNCVIGNLIKKKSEKSAKFDTLDENTDELNTDTLDNDLKQQQSNLLF